MGIFRCRRKMEHDVWIHRRLSKLRPSSGDDVRTCGHQQASYFFFNAADSMNDLHWIGLCRQCFTQHAHEPKSAVTAENGIPASTAE